ncbi:hypothetical protein VNO77_41102 [Canavalia gladiata]|uniref:Uncharacterized protein n=1 Tax=Canavalia gladiata TaxID=3824 RepID=A0AAN9PRV7_CANGL
MAHVSGMVVLTIICFSLVAISTAQAPSPVSQQPLPGGPSPSPSLTSTSTAPSPYAPTPSSPSSTPSPSPSSGESLADTPAASSPSKAFVHGCSLVMLVFLAAGSAAFLA